MTVAGRPRRPDDVLALLGIPDGGSVTMSGGGRASIEFESGERFLITVTPIPESTLPGQP